MAKIRQGILGGVQGKIGNVVGSSWKGIATLKSLPLSVANPKTPAQTAQRTKFSQVVATARTLLGFLITTYWNPFAQRMSGYNRFVQENIDAFDSDGLATPADFFAARGSLEAVAVSSVSSDTGANTVTVNYSDNSGDGDALETDKVVVVAFNKTKNVWANNAAAETRADGSSDVSFPSVEISDEIHIYTFAARADNSKVSDSVYNLENV